MLVRLLRPSLFCLGVLATAAACAPPGGAHSPAPPAPRVSAARDSASGQESGVGPGSDGIVGTPARAPQGADAQKADALSRAILDQVNQVRRQAGRQVLLHDERLGRAAQTFARELAARRSLDHNSSVPGRHTFLDRLAAEGARPREARFTHTGVGVSPGSDGVWYVTEEYSTRP